MRRRILIAFPLLLFVTACHRREAPSAIVERLESAGAGHLSTALVNSIQQWLQQHENLALEVKKECERVSKSQSPTANWGGTTEGRVCTAAANASFYHPFKGDNKAH
jgi:hypothetical protein